MRAFPHLALVCTAMLLTAVPSEAAQHKKYEEPKSQVQPLPPEPPAALAVDTDTLDFHISPLLGAGGLAAQIRTSLSDLIRDTRGETIVKLRAFVAGSGDARRVQAMVTDLFTEHKLPLPVLSILQVGALGKEYAQVVIEAVVSTHRTVNPNGLAFFYDQQGNSVEAAAHRLHDNASATGIDPAHVLTFTCFTGFIDNYEKSAASVHALFPQTQVNFVQAVRDPSSQLTTCEAVAQLSAPPEKSPVELLEETHVTLVHSQQLIFTGLQLTFGRYLDDGETAFTRLKHTATALQPLETPIQVNAFALDPHAGAVLRKTASLSPAMLHVEDIEGLQAIDATAGIEAILAPGISTATIIHTGIKAP